MNAVPAMLKHHPAATVVVLTSCEMLQAVQAAGLRNIENLQKGRVEVYGAAEGKRGDFQIHLEGCVGELAVAKLTNNYWPGKGTFGGPDVGHRLQTKCSQNPAARHLVLHPPRDPKDADYYFVYWRRGSFMCEVIGPVSGEEAMRPKFYRSPGDGLEPAVFDEAFWYPICDVLAREPESD